MGNKASKQPINLDEVTNTIQRYQPRKIEIGWYQKKGYLKHTGLVIICDGVKRFTIDYGTSNGKSTAQKTFGGKRGGVHLHHYQEEYVFKGILAKLNPSELIPFIEKCLKKASDDYNLVFHNCRHFVCEVFEELEKEKKTTKEASEMFLEDMKIVKKKDEKKLIHYIRIQVVKFAMFGGKFCRLAEEKIDMIKQMKKKFNFSLSECFLNVQRAKNQNGLKRAIDSGSREDLRSLVG